MAVDLSSSRSHLEYVESLRTRFGRRSAGLGKRLRLAHSTLQIGSAGLIVSRSSTCSFSQISALCLTENTRAAYLWSTSRTPSPTAGPGNRASSSSEVDKSEVVVAHKMVHDGVSSVVITENGRVVGIVNRLDLYAAIVGLERD